MFMLISVCECDIDTNIYNTKELAQEAMMLRIEEVFRNVDLLDEMYERKGDDWDTHEFGGWISCDINDYCYTYRIVKLPSMIVELI